MQDRHFTAPVDEIAGTVEEVSPGGIKLKEYPGRLFQFSSVSTSAADMSARILGEHRSLRPAAHKNPRAGATEPRASPGVRAASFLACLSGEPAQVVSLCFRPRRMVFSDLFSFYSDPLQAEIRIHHLD